MPVQDILLTSPKAKQILPYLETYLKQEQSEDFKVQVVHGYMIEYQTVVTPAEEWLRTLRAFCQGVYFVLVNKEAK